MTLTLELSPETEARLRANAAQYGLPMDAYLLDLAAQDAQEFNDWQALDRVDLHEYSAEELAAMEAGLFERPLR